MKKILFIDEDRETRDFYAQMLSIHEMKVDLASDGQQGLEMASQGDYMLLILDIVMSKVDGLTFLQKKKNLGMPGKVVIFTNIPYDEVKDKLVGYEIALYLAKSETSPAEFVKKISTLF